MNKLIPPHIYVGLPFKERSEALSQYTRNDKLFKIRSIFECVCEAHDEDVKHQLENTTYRKREYVQLRQIYMYLARKRTRVSYSRIGGLLGKDHATVLHGIKTISNLLETPQGKDIQEIINIALLKLEHRSVKLDKNPELNHQEDEQEECHF